MPIESTGPSATRDRQMAPRTVAVTRILGTLEQVASTDLGARCDEVGDKSEKAVPVGFRLCDQAVAGGRDAHFAQGRVEVGPGVAIHDLCDAVCNAYDSRQRGRGRVGNVVLA